MIKGYSHLVMLTSSLAWPAVSCGQQSGYARLASYLYVCWHSLELTVQVYKIKPSFIRSFGESIYRFLHYTGEQPYRFTTP